MDTEFGIWYSNVSNNHRYEELAAFAKAASGNKSGSLVAISGDASFRKYYRFLNFIVVDSPPQTQKNVEFIRIDRALGAVGIKVPSIYAYDLDKGFFLLEDLGRVSFAQKAVGSLRFDYYRKALDVLQRLPSIPDSDLPLFDRAFMMFELRLFKEWMLEKKLGVKLEAQERAALEESFEFLCSSCLAQPYIAVHRDFHCRNLMVVDSNQIAVIDFQDMVKGPLCYDLASLLFDCYVKLEDELVLKLKHLAFNDYRKLNLIGGAFEQFDRMLTLTSLQRHVKVLGIFCRLSLRDGKHLYLKDLPRVIDYVKQEARGFDELRGLLAIVEKYVIGKFQ